MACTQRLITKRVSRVCIGILDPNPDIRGQGEWLLEEVGISVGKFDSDLVSRIKAQNSEFIDYMLGIGLTISSPSPDEMLRADPISVRGTYRILPRPGDRIVVFGRSNFTYYPQAPIVWNRHERTWECPRVFLAAGSEPKQYGIVVARISEDLGVWLRSYTNVHDLTGKWVGAQLPSLPPGFEVLATVNITRAAKEA